MSDYQNEFETKELDGNTEEAAEENKEKRIFTDKEGNEVSMSAFVREKFLEDNMSRKDISEQFNIPYRTVYGATVNLVNDAEPTTRGRSAVNPKIFVTEDNRVVSEVDGVQHINGEPNDEVVETVETDRNSWIKEMVEKGMNRGDVAKALGISYGVVYGLTKDAEGTRQKHMITLENGEEITRAEYIRRRVEEGISKAELAKELDVDYSVIWQATKKDKTVEEKYEDAVKALNKFAEHVEDEAGFNELIGLLNAVEFKKKEEDAADAE